MPRNSVSVLTANRFCARTRDESSLLTRDDDFFARMNVEDTVGIPFQENQTLSAREVGDVVHELSGYIDQSDVTLEYVSRNWL